MLMSAASMGASGPASGTAMYVKLKQRRNGPRHAQMALRERAHLHGEPTPEEVAHRARAES